jgi:hypothetical protein
MPSAGDIYYHALSGAGEDIGKAIQLNILRNQKQKAAITQDMAILDRLSQMPDPTDPTGKKTLVDQKKMMALRQLKGAQLQAAAEGEIAAIELGDKIYKSSAPIRALTQGPQTTTDESGQKWRWSGKEWIPVAGSNSQQKAEAAKQRTLDSRLKQYNLNRRLLFDSSQHEGGILQKADKNKPDKTFVPEADPDKMTHIRVGYQDEKNPGKIISKSDLEGLQDLAAQNTDDPEWSQGALKWIRDNPQDPRAAKWLDVLKSKVMGNVITEEPFEATPDESQP